MKKSTADRAIDIFVYAFMGFCALITLLPFVNILAKSVSEQSAVISGRVNVLPVGFQLDTLKYVVTSKAYLNSFLNSVIVTLVGTAIGVFVTGMTAYPLSKRHLSGMKPILLCFIFTMLFSGGLVPNYLLIKQLGLYNTYGALILPGAINVFNMLIFKNYYESLPESLEESAKLDGANNFVILIKIIVPLSMPVLATICLFTAVALWNEYFQAMLYITKVNLKTLQLYLRDIVMEAQQDAGTSADDLMNISGEGVRAATIIAATVPILLVYPFMQKYFIKGILIGSVKG